MMEIGIISAPRKNNYLLKSVNSLRRSGFDQKIKIFAEPDTQDPGIKDTDFYYNSKKLGCFKNYASALRALVYNTDAEHVAILSDDFIYTPKAKLKLDNYLRELSNYGFLAMYTPRGTHPMVKNKGLNKVNLGWGNMWGGLYVFPRLSAKLIIEHDVFVDHHDNYEKNQQIDHLIPKVCDILGLDQWYVNPSLADHIGMESTIGHIHFIK